MGSCGALSRPTCKTCKSASLSWPLFRLLGPFGAASSRLVGQITIASSGEDKSKAHVQVIKYVTLAICCSLNRKKVKPAQSEQSLRDPTRF